MQCIMRFHEIFADLNKKLKKNMYINSRHFCRRKKKNSSGLTCILTHDFLVEHKRFLTSSTWKFKLKQKGKKVVWWHSYNFFFRSWPKQPSKVYLWHTCFGSSCHQWWQDKQWRFPKWGLRQRLRQH